MNPEDNVAILRLNEMKPYFEKKFTRWKEIAASHNERLPKQIYSDIGIRIVQKVVAKNYNVSVILMTKKNFRGKQPISDARLLSMELCSLFKLANDQCIAMYHGRKDHTSVVHARQVSRDRGIDPKFVNLRRECINKITVRLEKFTVVKHN